MPSLSLPSPAFCLTPCRLPSTHAPASGRAARSGRPSQVEPLAAAVAETCVRSDGSGFRPRVQLARRPAAARAGLRNVQLLAHGDEDVFLRGAVTPVEETAPRVLLFGTLARYKGIDVLLDAFTTVRRLQPDAELLITGVPVDVDVDALRAAGRIPGVALRLGYVPADEVSEVVGALKRGRPSIRGGEPKWCESSGTHVRPARGRLERGGPTANHPRRADGALGSPRGRSGTRAGPAAVAAEPGRGSQARDRWP